MDRAILDASLLVYMRAGLLNARVAGFEVETRFAQPVEVDASLK